MKTKTSKKPAKKAASKKVKKATAKKPAKKVAAKKPAKKVAKKPSKKTTKPVKSVKPKKVVAKKPTKKPFKAVAVKPAKPAKPSKNGIETSIPTVFTATKKQKYRKPAIVQTEHGLGLVYDHEPQVTVKVGMIPTKKTIVHLVKDNLEPRLMGGNPKKILTNNFTVIKPSYEEKPVRAKREKGEPSNKDFSKYKFQNKLYSKGRLIHAVIAKFAEENDSTMIELKTAFPDEIIRPYGKGLFTSLEEAERINVESKRSRFFTKTEDVIKIKGAKIAVSNQIDATLVQRFLTVTVKLGYKITQVESEKVSVPVVKEVSATVSNETENVSSNVVVNEPQEETVVTV